MGRGQPEGSTAAADLARPGLGCRDGAAPDRLGPASPLVLARPGLAERDDPAPERAGEGRRLEPASAGHQVVASASPGGRRSAMLLSSWPSDGSRPAPPGTCTSGTCAPPFSP